MRESKSLLVLVVTYVPTGLRRACVLVSSQGILLAVSLTPIPFCSTAGGTCCTSWSNSQSAGAKRDTLSSWS